MRALLCKINWMRRYHGDEDDYSGFENKEKTNFINFNGTYYGYLPVNELPIKHHHVNIDYVIFFAENQKGKNKVVGWYKNATIFRDEQLFYEDCPYFVKAKDTDVFLLEEKKRVLTLNINESIKFIELDKKIIDYLNKSSRINYHTMDELAPATISLSNINTTYQLIEEAIASEEFLNALHIIQLAVQTFGQLSTLVYYQAYVLYLFQQYDRSAIVLYELAKTNSMKEHAYFLLGVIFFDTEAYVESINMLKRVKQLNIDQSAYIISQAYAMLENQMLALDWIDKAIAFMPQEESYKDYKKHLEDWSV